MFAVPGWSLGPLKREEPQDNTSKEKRSSKKRKRGQDRRDVRSNGAGGDAGAKSTNVAGENVGELWKQHIDKKQHKSKNATIESSKEDEDGAPQSTRSDYGQDNIPQATSAENNEELQQSHKKRNKRGRQKTRDGGAGATKNISADSLSSAPIPPQSATISQAHTKLTPMQAAMRQKLISARFRHLNQTLYTAPSSEADQLFQANPSFFEEYHAGFRQQVASWPENPVDAFLRELKRRGVVHSHHGKKARSNPSPSGPQALPRTNGTCSVADLGCGDARLAQQLLQASGKLNIKVLGYDLQSDSPLVVKADISRLPLESGSVNVAIFCLALMGTNWIDFIEEAWRVLHWKGELWVAEIKSRFARSRDKRVPHSIGKRQKAVDRGTAGAKGKEAEAEEEEEQLRVEVDGSSSTREQTDVSTFVQVLERRGFALRGQDGIDLSNKMFVRLHFIKSKSPTKGKHAKPGQATSDDRDEVRLSDETAVLKPCLYKTR